MLWAALGAEDATAVLSLSTPRQLAPASRLTTFMAPPTVHWFLSNDSHLVILVRNTNTVLLLYKFTRTVLEVRTKVYSTV